jgi:UDP-N-acetylglucosamine acyltransferase
VIANNVMMAGHVVIGNYVNMMGGVGLHHFVTIGDFAYLGGYARIHHDVPPFVKIDGADQVRGLNKVGMSRAGMAAEDIAAVDAAYRKLFTRKKPFAIAMQELDSMNGELNPHVRTMLDFLKRRDEGRNGRYQESLRQK